MKNLKPIVVYNDKLLDRLGLFMKIKGMALFPFILLRERLENAEGWEAASAKRTINHETIHFQQALELFVIPFYILYIIEYGIKLLVYKGNMGKAYRNISFEREAFTNDDNLDYLPTRKRYNWIKLIF